MPPRIGHSYDAAVLRRGFGPLFIFTGILHFLIPRVYEAIMPDWLPAHRELIYASGVAEIVGGAALLHPRTRAFGSAWSIATLVAVFPANLHMALHPDRYRAIPGGPPALWARLPFQVALILWARAAAKP